jgi:hypothetical protein
MKSESFEGIDGLTPAFEATIASIYCDALEAVDTG